MFQVKTLLFLSFLGFLSHAKTETGRNKYKESFAQINEPYAHSSKKTLGTLMRSLYPPYIIQHLLRRNILFVPVIASNSAIYNKNVYGQSKSENAPNKRHPKSVFIVYPENQRPTNQLCNLNVTEPFTTIPPSTTIIENHKTEPSISTSSPMTTSLTITSAIPNTSTTEKITRPAIQTTITTNFDKLTTTTAINPNQLTPTTPHPWTPTPPTISPPTRPIFSPPTRPSTSPPAIKDPIGIGKMQCSFNGLYRANNFTCDQYLVCINGITYLMDCPNGLAFNDDKKTCDWPGNVEGCNPRAFEDFECPYDMSAEDNTISKFRYRDSCSQFIACYKRKPRLLICKNGFSFDEDSEDCIYYKSVTNCKNIVYPV